MAIRVLRLLEYVYENEEVAAKDMANWTHAHRTQSSTMRSATLPFEAVSWSTPDRFSQCAECKMWFGHMYDCSLRPT